MLSRQNGLPARTGLSDALLVGVAARGRFEGWEERCVRLALKENDLFLQ